MNTETLARNIAYLNQALGGMIRRLLADDTITEIMVNPDGTLWAEQHGTGPERVAVTYEVSTRESIIKTVAALLGVVATKDHPIIQGELPFSHHRFQGIIPPVSQAPCFTIRKHTAQLLTISDYVRDGIMTNSQSEILHEALRNQDTILISGASNSGKTTLANSLLTAIAGNDAVRVVIIEDTRELQCRAANVVTLRTSEHITLRDLVRSALRLRPDRLIVGEVRGPEALDLLKAWNTGHRGGLSSIHANSVGSVYARLAGLVAENAGYALPPAVFAEAINLLVHMEYDGQSRRVTDIVRVVPSGQTFELVPFPKGQPQ